MGIWLFVQDCCDSHTFFMVDATRTLLLVSQANGTVQVQTGQNIDFETRNVYNSTLQVSDNRGATWRGYYALPVRDINELPTSVYMTLVNSTSTLYSVPEFLPSDTLVGTLYCRDPDTWQNHTFSLQRLAGAPPPFYISQGTRNNSALLYTNMSLDSSVQGSYYVRITECVCLSGIGRAMCAREKERK